MTMGEAVIDWLHGRPRPIIVCRECGRVSFSRQEADEHFGKHAMTSKANDRQEGGSHYKKLAIQPWDYILANGIGFCEGNAITYLTRWQDKGGIQDLRKAVHFIEKLIETEEAKTIGNR